MQPLQKNQLRPQVVDLLARLIAPLVGTGVLTAAEHEIVFSNLRHIAKHGCPTPAILPKFLTPQEVAELLSISYSQFRALEKEGAFPFKRHMIGGKTVRYLNTEVIAYMLSEPVDKNHESREADKGGAETENAK